MKLALISIGAVALAAPALAHQHQGHSGHGAHDMSKPHAMQCAPVTAAAVEQQFTAFNEAWATRNPDTVTALFAPDAVLLATVSNTPRDTPAEIRDYFVGFLQKSPVGAIDTSTVKLGCNSASRLGTWTVTLTDPKTGEKTPVKARYSFIYGYQDGKWMIEHLHSSMMPETAGK